MREILRTVDPVLVSFIEALLAEARISYHVADLNTSVMEGSIGVFPRRILVRYDHYADACQLMRDAGLDETRSPSTSDAKPSSWRGLAGGFVSG